MSTTFTALPPPPYYAVIFSSQRCSADGDDGYDSTAERMATLAAEQPGYLGMETTRGSDGFGITISYWRDEASILAWKRDAEHSLARERGRTEWYSDYTLRVARVERAYGMTGR